MKKVGLRIKELERLYGIRDGSAGGNGSNQYTIKKLEPNNSAQAKTQEDIATQMGISVDTLHNYKLLADMIPELSDLVDTGVVTKTTVDEKIREPNNLVDKAMQSQYGRMKSVKTSPKLNV